MLSAFFLILEINHDFRSTPAAMKIILPTLLPACLLFIVITGSGTVYQDLLADKSPVRRLLRQVQLIKFNLSGIRGTKILNNPFLT